MAVILGTNVFISKVNGSTVTAVIAAAKSCTISKSIDMIEKASSTQGTYKEYTTGLFEWEVSLDHLIVTGKEFEGINAVGETFSLRMTVNGVVKNGTAICQHSDLSAPVGGLAKGSVKFRGSGALT